MLLRHMTPSRKKGPAPVRVPAPPYELRGSRGYASFSPASEA